MSEPFDDYIDYEELEELHAEIGDLLQADQLLAIADPAELRNLVARLIGLVRRHAEHDRGMAMLLRRQPVLAGRIADTLDARADAAWPESD